MASGKDISLFTTLVGATVEKIKEVIEIPFYEVVLHVPDVDGYANIPMTPEYFEMLEIVMNAKKQNGLPFIDNANCQSEPHPKILERTRGKMTIFSELTDRAGLLEGEDLVKVNNIQGEIECARAENLDHFVLLPNGEVVLCCNDFSLKHRLGNLLKNSYEEIINGSMMKSVKDSMLCLNNVDIICRNCMYAKRR